MATLKTRDLDTTLSALFDAERTVRKLHDELSGGGEALLDTLEAAAKAAQKEREEEASLRLVRIAALLGTQTGARVVDALIDLLDSEWEEPRGAAGEELEQLAFARFKDVALGVERALKRLPSGSIALEELPFILQEVPEPGVAKLLVGFLEHDDPNVVYAALSAAIELAEPDHALVRAVERLTVDPRIAEVIEDDTDELQQVPIAEAAKEAIEILAPVVDGDD